MTKRIHTVFFMLILVYGTVFGQADDVLKGKVTDRTTGEQLIGVTVIEVNELNRTLNGTVTDMNGNFVLRLNSPNTKVKISYIGYKTEEFII
ncbi:MAG: carboxypeptidase-like regulatory domain-containing protein, partial [Bacteroidales bacterium]|nr:carboxypeptidase-like regulatory domain-containing protein [Bacteroidales bacterium]